MKHLIKLLKNQDTKYDFSDFSFEKEFKPGLTLRSLRESRDVKQVEIYEGKGLKQSYLSNIEKGNRNPDLDLILIYSEALKMDYYDIMTAILKDYKEYLINEANKVNVFLDIKKKSLKTNKRSKKYTINKSAFNTDFH